jgi:hypothetical protein
VRLEAQALYRRQGGKDLCLKCEPVVRAPLEAKRPLRPDASAPWPDVRRSQTVAIGAALQLSEERAASVDRD